MDAKLPDYLAEAIELLRSKAETFGSAKSAPALYRSSAYKESTLAQQGLEAAIRRYGDAQREQGYDSGWEMAKTCDSYN